MCTKCCAYEGASPFVRKCGSVAGARRNEMYYVGRGEEEGGRRGKAPEKEESGAKRSRKK